MIWINSLRCCTGLNAESPVRHVYLVRPYYDVSKKGSDNKMSQYDISKIIVLKLIIYFAPLRWAGHWLDL